MVDSAGKLSRVGSWIKSCPEAVCTSLCSSPGFAIALFLVIKIPLYSRIEDLADAAVTLERIKHLASKFFGSSSKTNG